MSKTNRYTTEQVSTALANAKGMITLAAKSLGCNPQTVRNYIARAPGVAEAFREQREAMTDIAELALYRAIQNGEGWAIAMYLKTQGRERGYVEKQQVEHSGHIDWKTVSDDELRAITES